MDSERARAIIQSRLQRGEKLVWYDKPEPWRLALGRLGLAAFGIVFLGSTLTETETANNPQALGAVYAVGLGLVGWGLIGAVNCWRTAYGLTDRRAIIAVGETGSTRSFEGDAFYNIKCRGNDSGNLEFDYRSNNEGGWAYMTGFYGIRDPARVEAMIRENLLSPGKTSARSDAQMPG